MVATDIASRGIDVEGITHVVNFDVPCYAEDYLHRIGRTGRATAEGDAITFVSRDEMEKLRRIEKFISRKIKLSQYKGFTPTVTPPAAQPKKKSKPPQKYAGRKYEAKSSNKPQPRSCNWSRRPKKKR
jgi:ATP-dependent RNA helicase RhlE